MKPSSLGEPQFRFVDWAPPGEAASEVLVFPDKVVFRSEARFETEIARRNLFSVMNYSPKGDWLPDTLVVLYRDEQGVFNYFVWPIAEKNICRRVSNEIYKIIKNGLLKSVLGLFYVMTHPVKGAPGLYK